MVTKLEALYPDEKKADQLTKQDFETPAMKKLIKDCLNMKWPAAERESFMSSCIKNAAGLGEEKAKKYCNCMLEKIESKYATPADADTITEEEMNKPEWKKLIQGCLQ